MTTMALHSDLPPPYSTLHDSTAKLTAPDSVVSNDNGTECLANSFEDKDSRIGFIQKVLAITWLQIALVLIFMVSVLANDYSFGSTLYHNYAAFVLVSTLAFLGILALLVYWKGRWEAPYKYMFLVAHPLSFALFTCVLTFPHALDAIVIAWAYFCVSILILLFYSVLAFRTKIEFTTRNGIWVTAGLLIALAYSVPFLFYHVTGVFFPIVAVFFLCVYILVDLEAMMAKGYRFAITPSDFVKAALIIHIDYRYIIMKTFNSVPIY